MNIQKQFAFTLIEVMVTLVIVVILVTIGLPNWTNFLLNNQLTSQTNSLVATLNFARSEAITQNRAINITAIDPAADNNNEWGKGWEIWLDKNNDPNIDDDEIIRKISFNTTTTIDGPDNLLNVSLAGVDGSLKSKTVSYRGNGTLAVSTNIVFTICDNRTGEIGRQISFFSTGRVFLANNKFQCE